MSSNERITGMDFTAPPIVAQWQKRALLVGAVFTVATIIGFIVEPRQALHSYLIAFMFTLGLTLGSMALLMVWYMTGGEWGMMIRRIFEAAMSTLPMMVAAFIPVVLAPYLHLNYPWANPEEVKHSEHIAHQAAQYLNPNLFLFRGVMYFLAWGLLAYWLMWFSRAQDRAPERAYDIRLRAISAAGVIIYGWTLTFAVVDWVMSLNPEFTSTIYGLIFMVGQALIALCFTVIVAHALRQFTPLSAVLHSRHFLDYGKLMLTFVMLWAYFSYSQWLIIWSGNLPDEIHWFLDRIHGDWGLISFVLIIGHFAVPFALLLSRPLKQNSGKLMWIAGWLILMRYLDLYWNIEPNFSKAALHFSWLDAVIPIAMFALWMAYFFRNLARRPLLALHDPHLRAVMEAEHE